MAATPTHPLVCAACRLHPFYKELHIEDDNAVLSGGCLPLSPALDFLDNEASKESLERSEVLQ